MKLPKVEVGQIWYDNSVTTLNQHSFIITSIESAGFHVIWSEPVGQGFIEFQYWDNGKTWNSMSLDLKWEIKRSFDKDLEEIINDEKNQ